MESRRRNASRRRQKRIRRRFRRYAEIELLNYSSSPFYPFDFPYSPDVCLSFTGHRMIPEAARKTLEPALSRMLEMYYENGKRVFLSGGALGFDTLAAQAVLRLREKHSDTKLVIAVPCRSQASRWSPADQAVYQRILSRANLVLYISEDYFPGCMQKRNRFLVEHADTCLCYLTHCRGGTWNTVSLAYDMERKIVNLAT